MPILKPICHRYKYENRIALDKYLERVIALARQFSSVISITQANSFTQHTCLFLKGEDCCILPRNLLLLGTYKLQNLVHLEVSA